MSNNNNNIENNFVEIITGPCTEQLKDPPITFPYECDDFQKHAFSCISKGENVLVTAATGCGKTIVGEFGIANTINKNLNVVYTSPIKSLSNEKYNDFRNKFQGSNINLGILTGDNKINPDGNCLIMTAEILRNALYKLKSDNKAVDVIDNKYDIKANFLDKLGCVIMDEVHFINDPDRGKVWEESIVLINNNVQLILLSATISEPYKFAKWIGNIKQKKINLISTTHRVVPLHYYIYTGNNLHQIFDQNNNYKPDNYIIAKKEYLQLQKIRQQKHKSETNFTLIQDTIKYLQKHNMFQTIFFSFSKKNCEYYAQTINEIFISQSEIKEIDLIYNKYMHKYEKQYEKLEQYQTVKKLLSKGIAFHHSGLLPILKEIIEIIFHKGLIKVLFATETFAVGVNMPTRTVVFVELEKFTTHDGKRSLLTSEFRQMSGRSGRRGIDTSGNVIILPLYDFPEDQLLKTLLTGMVPYIQSQFKIDYQFYLKIIQSEHTNITSFLNDSLFNLENIQQQIIKEKELNIINDKIKTLNFDQTIIPKSQLTLIKELYKLQNTNTDQLISGIKISISKDKIKKMNTLKNEINKDKSLRNLYENYCRSIELDKKCNEIITEINDCKSYSGEILDNIKTFLKRTKFIMDDTVVLVKGIIASQINECNAIILTEMITEGFFKGLLPEEIVGMLAIFIEETKSEDKMNLNDVEATPKLKEYIYDIMQIIDDYKYIEQEIGINNNSEYWDISFDFVDAAYNWAKDEVTDKVFEKLDNIYIGNFIRNMIKINNIVKDIILLLQINNDNESIPILEKIEPMIMKEFVTINSLYLS